MNYKVKIISGFRLDQEYSIPAEEAHKAYFLFHHPDARTVFSTGLAITGVDVKKVVPDYHGTMGWNASHILDSDDHNELRARRIQERIASILKSADEIGRVALPNEIALPLTQLLTTKYKALSEIAKRTGGSRSIGELLAQNPE